MVNTVPGAASGVDEVIAISGGVASMLKLFDTVAELPATSITVPVAVWLTPSSVNTRSGGQTATPDSGSAHVKCAVTGAPR